MSDGLNVNGVRVLAAALDRRAQEALVADLREVARSAPFRNPVTAGGKRMSVQMTAAGQFGWVSDRRGYRYEPRQCDGAEWPAIPARLLKIWHTHLPAAKEPQSCLINYYGENTKMGMHQDKDEADLSQPVLSLSLGDEALFRVGPNKRGRKTASVWLKSGDIAILEGQARMAYHGIERIRFKSSSLLPRGGRLNVTMRVVR